MASITLAFAVPTFAQEPGSAATDEDPARYGPPPEILENADLARLMRRAAELKERGEVDAALTLLLTELQRSESDGPQAAGMTGSADDERLFWSTPEALRRAIAALGVEAARIRSSRDEGAARRALEAASATPGPDALIDVAERFLLTEAGAVALYRAGNRQLDQGDVVGALRSYGDLRELNPDEVLSNAGIDQQALAIREATALELLGRDSDARERLQMLPDGAESPIEGNSVAIDELESRGVLGDLSGLRTEDGEPRLDPELLTREESWTVLWEFRFTEPRPYRIAQPGDRDRIRILPSSGDGNTGGVDLLPFLDFVPGTRVGFVDDRVLAFDHQRPVAFDSQSGRRLSIGDGETEPPDPQTGVLRNRIPILDFERAQFVDSGLHLHTTVTPAASPRNTPPSPIVTLDRHTLAKLWSTEEDPAISQWSFLAAPIVDGDSLIAPYLDGDSIGVASLNVESGGLQWHSILHAAGSFYRRPPTPQVTIENGTVFVITNAGVAACLDANDGQIRWLRRYERAHPTRETQPDSNVRGRPWPSTLRVARHRALLGFVPTAPIRFESLVILAPSDGDLLIALDAIDGQLAWLMPREVRGNVSSRRYELESVLGIDDGRLMVAGPDELVAVDARSGVRLWREAVPGGWVRSKWRGRGLCADGMVILPGEDQVLFRSLGEDGAWTSTPLPASPPEQEPLEGPMNLFLGPDVLIAAYQGGLRALTKPSILIAAGERSDDPETRLRAWLQAGDPDRALTELLAMREQEPWANDRTDLAIRLLREVADNRVGDGASDEAFALVDEVSEGIEDGLAADRLLVLRAELHRDLGDLDKFRTLMAELRDRRGGGAP
ncbi:MAG: PQQ-binding-like beta-propeller repeat protein [Planctomycetota bacterium]